MGLEQNLKLKGFKDLQIDKDIMVLEQYSVVLYNLKLGTREERGRNSLRGSLEKLNLGTSKSSRKRRNPADTLQIKGGHH
jgi:hypothetical protein